MCYPKNRTKTGKTPYCLHYPYMVASNHDHMRPDADGVAVVGNLILACPTLLNISEAHICHAHIIGETETGPAISHDTSTFEMILGI